MIVISERVTCTLYEIILEKVKVGACAELSKCKAQYSFGKLLVKMEEYEKANNILKEALKCSEENIVSGNYIKLFSIFIQC